MKNVRVVRPGADTIDALDIGITDGSFSALSPDLDPAEGANVFNGVGLLAFPGVVDAHMHFGIYHPLSEDIATESRAAAVGGVTTGISYIRTGQYYLNRAGPYSEFFPTVLEMSEGRSHVDYGYHLAPMTNSHIGEIEDLIGSDQHPEMAVG